MARRPTLTATSRMIRVAYWPFSNARMCCIQKWRMMGIRANRPVAGWGRIQIPSALTIKKNATAFSTVAPTLAIDGEDSPVARGIRIATRASEAISSRTADVMIRVAAPEVC